MSYCGNFSFNALTAAKNSGYCLFPSAPMKTAKVLVISTKPKFTVKLQIAHEKVEKKAVEKKKPDKKWFFLEKLCYSCGF